MSDRRWKALCSLDITGNHTTVLEAFASTLKSRYFDAMYMRVVPGGMIAHTFPRPVTFLFFLNTSFLVLPFQAYFHMCRVLNRIDSF